MNRTGTRHSTARAAAFVLVAAASSPGTVAHRYHNVLQPRLSTWDCRRQASPLMSAHRKIDVMSAQQAASGVSIQLTSEWPPYCCVILQRPSLQSSLDSSELFVEQRPLDASVAAGRLTCFGGKREANEDPVDAVLRECVEELGWAPERGKLSRAVDLFVNDKLIACK